MMGVLNAAMRLIPGTSITYRKYIGNAVNEIGVRVPTYETLVAVGHIQPVPSRMYARFGLTLGKKYDLLHIKAHVVGVDQQTSGDLVTWQGKTYTPINVSDWFAYDGWTRLVLTERKED